MESSLRFYVDGLGFKMKNYWIPEGAEDHPDGRIRWCWLELGEAAIMLQEFRPGSRPKETLGTGVNVCFQCERRVGSLSRFQIARNSDAETSICRKPHVGCAGYRSRRLSH